ncbi:MAG: BatA domain-containing protein, partial [Planctomycetota bacterium]
MVGFLAAGVLGGLVAIGWPLYLHLRKRQKPVVQMIPSLRLFDTAKRLTRFTLFERIILLAARVLFLVFLCLLLAQPYFETERHLSLPRLDERSADCCVGLLLDDSLTALHGPVGETRLDMSRTWFRKQLGELPARARVTIALASFPYPTRPMSKAGASELLDRVRVIPRAGRAAKGLARLHEQLRGKKGAIVVAAPRDGALWQDLSEGTDLESAAKVYFVDTTDRRLSWLIESIEPASHSGGGDGGDGWVLNLLGDPEAMADAELVA